jgi:hypothetical protein
MNAVKSFREEYGAELDDRIQGIANDPEADRAARQAQKERAETDRLARHNALAEAAGAALRGDWGKEAQDAVKRVLAGVEPRQAQTASLVVCESIVIEAKKRKREARKKRAVARGGR